MGSDGPVVSGKWEENWNVVDLTAPVHTRNVTTPGKHIDKALQSSHSSTLQRCQVMWSLYKVQSREKPKNIRIPARQTIICHSRHGAYYVMEYGPLFCCLLILLFGLPSNYFAIQLQEVPHGRCTESA